MSKTQSRKSNAIPLAEYIVGGIGLTVIVTVLAFLLWEAIRGSKKPADIVTSIQKITAQNGGYLALVSVKNRGDQTASQLKILARLNSGGDLEQREVTIDYLAADSEKIVGLFFFNKPKELALDVFPGGYVEP